LNVTLNETEKQEQTQERDPNPQGQTRSDAVRKPFGGLDPSEAGRRSGEKRRAKRSAAEARAEQAALDAAHDRLAVTARLAVVTARKLTTAQIDRLLDGLLDLAENGTGHVRRQAIGDLLAFARAAVEGGDEDTAEVDWSAMTPAQRAAARAHLDTRIAELVAQVQEGEEEAGG
jgi:hypothetical protein